MPLFLLAVWALLAVSVTPSPFYAVTPERFHFLPLQAHNTFEPIKLNNCSDSWQLYLAGRQVGNYSTANHGLFLLENCLLQNMSPLEAQDMNSALILLGLGPVMLSALAPTFLEVGLVSLHKPALALLLSLGSCTVYSSRRLTYDCDDARRVSGQPLPPGLRTLAVLAIRYPLAMGLFEYLVGAAAVFNVIHTSLQLGLASIFNQDGPVYFIPLVWTCFPVVLHLPLSAFLFFNQRRCPRPRSEDSTPMRRSWSTALRLQCMPTILHPPLYRGVLFPTLLISALHCSLSILATVHVIYGVLTYSSLMFVMTTDATVILLRYMASSLVCKLLLALELGGIRLSDSPATPAISLESLATHGK